MRRGWQLCQNQISNRSFRGLTCEFWQYCQQPDSRSALRVSLWRFARGPHSLPTLGCRDVIRRAPSRAQKREPYQPDIVAPELLWHPAGASEPFCLDLSTYFAEILG